MRHTILTAVIFLLCALPCGIMAQDWHGYPIEPVTEENSTSSSKSASLNGGMSYRDQKSNIDSYSNDSPGSPSIGDFAGSKRYYRRSTIMFDMQAAWLPRGYGWGFNVGFGLGFGSLQIGIFDKEEWSTDFAFRFGGGMQYTSKPFFEDVGFGVQGDAYMTIQAAAMSAPSSPYDTFPDASADGFEFEWTLGTTFSPYYQVNLSEGLYLKVATGLGLQVALGYLETSWSSDSVVADYEESYGFSSFGIYSRTSVGLRYLGFVSQIGVDVGSTGWGVGFTAGYAF